MLHVERKIHINAPIDKVFNYIADAAHMPEWSQNFTEMHLVEGAGIGRTYDYTYKMIGLPMHGKVKIVEEIPSQMHHAKSTGAISSDWMWRFQPEGTGTSVLLLVDYEVETPVIGGVVEKLAASRTEKDTDTALVHLREKLELN